MQDLPENHFWVSGASWVNIIKLQYICFSMFCAHQTVWVYNPLIIQTIILYVYKSRNNFTEN